MVRQIKKPGCPGGKNTMPTPLYNEETDMVKNLSYSSLNTFATCPRRWWVQYVLGKRTPSGEAAGFGNEFDQEIAACLGLGEEVEEKSKELRDATKFYFKQPDAWTWADEAQKKIEITPGQFEAMAEDLDLAVSGLRFPFIGYLDLFRQHKGTTEVLDLKTSGRREFRTEWAIQVFGIYSLATTADSAIVHQFVRTKKPQLVAYHWRPNPETWRWAVQWIDYYSALINAALDENCGEELPRTPGFYCNWCPEQFECIASCFNNM